MDTKNVKLVNKTGSDVRLVEEYILNAIDKNEALPKEIEDIFNLEILHGYNPDGSDRGILTFA